VHLVSFYYKNIPTSVDIRQNIYADKCRQTGQKTNRNWIDKNNMNCLHLFTL